MGCDIHMHTEQRINGKWINVGRGPTEDRDYALFCILAGVRYGVDLPPIAEPKGFPPDAAKKTLKDFQSSNQQHLASPPRDGEGRRREAMRKGAKAAFVRRLGEMKLEAETLARDIEAASEGPPFSLSVGWGNAPQAIISIDDREVHRHVLEEHVDKCIWALFESCRDGGDPGDPKAFKRVLDRINAEARKRCFQRDETPTRSEE